MQGKPRLEYNGLPMMQLDSRRRCTMPVGKPSSVYSAEELDDGTIILKPFILKPVPAPRTKVVAE